MDHELYINNRYIDNMHEMMKAPKKIMTKMLSPINEDPNATNTIFQAKTNNAI